jgi:phosphatidylglycerophosphate synthase
MLGFMVAYSLAMTSVKQWGRRIQDFMLKAPAEVLHRFRVSPHAVSLVSLFLVYVSALLIYRHDKLYLAALPAAILFDMLDGTLARMYSPNEFGVFFDYLLDRFSDAMIILSLAMSGMLGYVFQLTLLFFYALSTLLVKVLEAQKIKVYVLSFRTITVAALFLQEAFPQALWYISCGLLASYVITAAAALPKAVFRHR